MSRTDSSSSSVIPLSVDGPDDVTSSNDPASFGGTKPTHLGDSYHPSVTNDTHDLDATDASTRGQRLDAMPILTDDLIMPTQSYITQQNAQPLRSAMFPGSGSNTSASLHSTEAITKETVDIPHPRSLAEAAKTSAAMMMDTLTNKFRSAEDIVAETHNDIKDDASYSPSSTFTSTPLGLHRTMDSLPPRTKQTREASNSYTSDSHAGLASVTAMPEPKDVSADAAVMTTSGTFGDKSDSGKDVLKVDRWSEHEISHVKDLPTTADNDRYCTEQT